MNKNIFQYLIEHLTKGWDALFKKAITFLLSIAPTFLVLAPYFKGNEKALLGSITVTIISAFIFIIFFDFYTTYKKSITEGKQLALFLEKIKNISSRTIEYTNNLKGYLSKHPVDNETNIHIELTLQRIQSAIDAFSTEYSSEDRKSDAENIMKHFPIKKQ
jgi:hypothetical protein